VSLAPRAGLDVCLKRKAFGSCQELNHNFCFPNCSIVTILAVWALKEVDSKCVDILTWFRID
jgi:hypothetical protein